MKDSAVFIAYHINDPFKSTDGNTRALYYYPGGSLATPTVWADGVFERAGVGYAQCRADFNTRKVISSPLSIGLSGSYNAGTRTGTIMAQVTNTSGSSVSGKLHFIVVETAIPYSWYNEDSVFNVPRDCLPDGNGEAVSIAAGSSIDKSRNFTLNTGWNANKCDIIVFVQGTSKEMYQGQKVHIMDISVEETPKIESVELKLEILPNPVSRRAVIQWSAPNACDNSRLMIYDLSGRLVKGWERDNLATLSGKVVWDGRDEFGEYVGSGIYLCVLKSGSHMVVNKVLLTR
ncbi:MAG: Omp28-related outer membrane protein [Candidatus Stahlbacteria bacterium]|nr:Omp28-related outer membrane protein [Candidatus Stahlbacteria bacterium]